MALIFDRASFDGGQFGHLMPLRFPCSLHLLDLRGQTMSTVPALFRQDGPNLIDICDGYQGPMRPAMAGLSTHLAPALLPSAPLSRLTG